MNHPLRTYAKSRFKRFETTDVDASRLAEGYTDVDASRLAEGYTDISSRHVHA